MQKFEGVFCKLFNCFLSRTASLFAFITEQRVCCLNMEYSWSICVARVWSLPLSNDRRWWRACQMGNGMLTLLRWTAPVITSAFATTATAISST